LSVDRRIPKKELSSGNRWLNFSARSFGRVPISWLVATICFLVLVSVLVIVLVSVLVSVFASIVVVVVFQCDARRFDGSAVHFPTSRKWVIF